MKPANHSGIVPSGGTRQTTLLLREAMAHADEREIAAACEAVAELFERSACGFYPTTIAFSTAAARARELLRMSPLILSQASVHAASAAVHAADTNRDMSYEVLGWTAESANAAGIEAHESESASGAYREHLDKMIDGVLCLLEAQTGQPLVRPRP